MKKCALITGLLVLAAIVAAGCGLTNDFTLETATATLSPTAAPTASPTVTPSPPPTHTPTPTLTPTSVYGGYASDSRIARRLTKGDVSGYDIVIKDHVAAVLTSSGIFVYDIEEKREISHLSPPYDVYEVDVFHNQGKYYVLTAFFVSDVVEKGKREFRKQGVSLWDASTGKQVWEFESPGRIDDWAISPDDKTLAVYILNYDGVVRLHFIDFATGIERVGSRILPPQNPQGWNLLTYSSDGQHLILAGEQILIYDVKTGKVVSETPNGDKKTTKTFLSPDENYLLLSSKASVKVYQKDRKGNYTFRFSKTFGTGVYFRPIGFISGTNQLLVKRAINDNWEFSIYDLDSDFQKSGTFEGTCDYRETVFPFSDGSPGLICFEKGDLLVYKLNTGEKSVVARGFTGLLYYTALSDDGSILATGDWRERINLWDVNSGDLIQMIEYPGESSPRSMSISPNNKILATYGYSDTLDFWDIRSGELISNKSILPAYSFLFFSNVDENRFYAVVSNQIIVGNVFSDETKTIFKNGSFTIPEEERDLYRLDDRKFVFSSAPSYDGKNTILKILSIAEAEVLDITIPAKEVYAGMISRDNKVMVFPYSNGREYESGFIVFDLENLTEVSNFYRGRSVNSLSIAPNNQWIAVGSNYVDPFYFGPEYGHKTTTIYDLKTGQKLASFGVVENKWKDVRGVFFTPDGQDLLVVSGTIDFWDVDALIR